MPWKLHSRKVTRFVRFLVIFFTISFPEKWPRRIEYLYQCLAQETHFVRISSIFSRYRFARFPSVAKGKLSRYLSNFDTSLRIFTVNETHPIMDKTFLKLYHPFVSQYLTLKMVETFFKINPSTLRYPIISNLSFIRFVFIIFKM